MKWDKKYSLKNTIENNCTWDGVFYQSEWANSVSVTFIFFHFMRVAAKASELFYMAD